MQSSLVMTRSLTLAGLPSAGANSKPHPSTGWKFSISLPENDQSKITQELPPFNSILSDFRPLLSRPNHFKFQSDHPLLGHQHRLEY